MGALFLFGLVGLGCAREGLEPSGAAWVEPVANPVIGFGDVVPGMLWNDPSVRREGGGYTMWLSGGRPFEPLIRVSIYRAVSGDGLSWEIAPTPVLEPGPPGSWDDLRVETPSVIRVGSTYHMYYSGCAAPCDTGQYDIGHATSRDGVTWVKDPANPVIRRGEDPLRWGFFTAAEPGALARGGEVHLYYVGARSNFPEPGAAFGVLRAVSPDGSRFGPGRFVHGLSEAYNPAVYRGISTPMAAEFGAQVYLFYDIVADPDGFEQVAISYAVSADGVRFEEQERNIVVAGAGWKEAEVLAPTVVIDPDSGRVRLWFSGRKNRPEFAFGIGYAEGLLAR